MSLRRCLAIYLIICSVLSFVHDVWSMKYLYETKSGWARLLAACIDRKAAIKIPVNRAKRILELQTNKFYCIRDTSSFLVTISQWQLIANDVYVVALFIMGLSESEMKWWDRKQLEVLAKVVGAWILITSAVTTFGVTLSWLDTKQ